MPEVFTNELSTYWGSLRLPVLHLHSDRFSFLFTCKVDALILGAANVCDVPYAICHEQSARKLLEFSWRQLVEGVLIHLAAVLLTKAADLMLLMHNAKLSGGRRSRTSE